MPAQRITSGANEVFLDTETLGGDGTIGNPVRVNATSPIVQSNNEYGGRRFQWNDDWLLGRQLAQGNGWDGIPIGGPPYSITLSGVNTAITPVTGSQRIGVVTLDTGTTNAGLAALSTAATLAMDSGLTPGGIDYADIHFEAVVGVQTLSTALEEFVCEVGLVGNAPGYGVEFIYDRATYGDFWVARTQEAGVKTDTVLDGVANAPYPAVPVATYTFPNTNIVRLDAEYLGTAGVGTVANFYVNDALVWQETNTLPTHSLAGTVSIQKTAGVNVRRFAIDYTSLTVDIRGTRVP